MYNPESKKPGGNRAGVQCNADSANTCKSYHKGPAELLARLDGLRETSKGQYLAVCPSHDDKSPSLSIKACNDGRLLIHCFAGCEALSVVQSVGLALADLYTKPLSHNLPPLSISERKRYSQALDALRALELETLLVEVCIYDVLNGEVIPESTRQSLKDAAERLKQARKVAA